MKKIFLFLAFLFVVSFLFAQRPVGNDSFQLQTVGSSNTFFKSKGAIGSDSGFVVAKFPDTVSANSSKLSHYPGAIMRTGNTLWQRDTTATHWMQFVNSPFDSTTIYNILNQKLNIIDTVGMWQAQGIYLTNFVRLTDSTVRYVFNFGDAYIDDTSRIAFTQENITYITNIFNYLDSLRGKDTTFIRGPTANGLPFAYSVIDPLSDNDTLHFYFPPNNIAGDSMLVTDVNGNLKQKLIPAVGGSGTVTSVAMTMPGVLFNTTVSGSPITTSGTLAPSLISQSAYTNFGNNTSGSATPTFFTNNFSDSLRRIGVNVSRRVNGVWINQYTDSTGAGGAAGWALTGNAGITPITNFLGTTDVQSIYFKTNNTIRAKIDSVGRIFIDSAQIGRGGGTSIGNNITNIAFGDSVLWNNTTGVSNTAIGYQALVKNTTVAGITAIGYKALNVSTGTGNTGVGSNVLLVNTTGTNNTTVGQSSLQANISGANNTAIGYSALTLNTGSSNTAVGSQALAANTSSQNNTAVGKGAAQSVTSGYNTAVGTSALGTATTGAQNTAVGNNSLGSVTGNGNTAIGVSSANQFTSGSNNTRIGAEYNLNSGITTGTRNTIIGADYVSQSSSLSDHVILAEGSGHVRFLSNANAQTGIRHINPTAVLQLAAGTPAYGKAPLKFTYLNLTTTAASSSGGTATLTFAAQESIPFSPGDTIVVAGITPSGFNGTYKVLTSTTTTVTYSNSTAGPQTVAGTITIGQLTTNPEAGAVEYSPSLTSGTTRPYFTGADGVRGMVSLTFTGTAAPSTTPSAIGDHFVDTTNKKEYVATGTASSADWTILN